jgi:FtsP/CotA-like multicopper oxidase with cupredoxin domain
LLVASSPLLQFLPQNGSCADGHPFMFDCHILEHEDAGMIGQYTCT